MKFKNTEPYPIKHKKLFYVALGLSFSLAFIHYLEYGSLAIENYAAIGLSIFLIYCIRFGGAYRIVRYLAERNIRKQDNKWKPKWYK